MRSVLLAVICMGLVGCSHQNQQAYNDQFYPIMISANMYPVDIDLTQNIELAENVLYNQVYTQSSDQAARHAYELHHRAKLNSPVKGIYISQSTVENRQYLQYLIMRSKEVGINTFIIDLNNVTNTYEKNILLVKNSGLRYVARIVVFPLGGNREKVKSEAYWMSRYRVADAAIKLGADEIQLDYIRYAASNSPSAQNAEDIHQVISWFKDKIGDRADLQIDVFGESSFKESKHIGQNVVTFAPSIDAMCPMLYPSHFEPYKDHAKRPYDIIYKALISLKSKFNGDTPFKLYPYIELSNYRHSFTEEQLTGYIHSQIKAVEDARADGWYAWSANNKYDRLFDILQGRS